MRHLKPFAACVVALALHSTAWAQVYETTDAQGNPDFTDTPPTANAEEIDLPETNLVNPPQPEQQAPPQAAPDNAVEQAPAQDNTTVNINGGNGNDDYDDGVYEDDAARQRAIDRGERAASGEVVDPGYEMPREVGDSNSQMPHEVGDSNSQMPHEVGDSNAEMPHEVGDFPAANEAPRR